MTAEGLADGLAAERSFDVNRAAAAPIALGGLGAMRAMAPIKPEHRTTGVYQGNPPGFPKLRSAGSLSCLFTTTYNWWRRRELNPRPEKRRRESLQA